MTLSFSVLSCIHDTEHKQRRIKMDIIKSIKENPIEWLIGFAIVVMCLIAVFCSGCHTIYEPVTEYEDAGIDDSGVECVDTDSETEPQPGYPCPFVCMYYAQCEDFYGVIHTSNHCSNPNMICCEYEQ